MQWNKQKRINVNKRRKWRESLAKADIVITTAQIPGKKAPVLITADMVNHMRIAR